MKQMEMKKKIGGVEEGKSEEKLRDFAKFR
jgi:hypothetical protein